MNIYRLCDEYDIGRPIYIASNTFYMVDEFRQLIFSALNKYIELNKFSCVMGLRSVWDNFIHWLCEEYNFLLIEPKVSLYFDMRARLIQGEDDEDS